MLKPLVAVHNFGDIGNLDHVFSELSFSKPTEIWINTFKNFPGQTHTQKIFIAVEPNAVCGFNKKIIKNASGFTHILTFEAELLTKLPQAVLCEFGSTWIGEYAFPEKTFSISMVCGFKQQTDGHKLRHKLWNIKHNITIPTAFYVSNAQPSNLYLKYLAYTWKKNHPTLGTSKLTLFDSQFHLAIENSRSPYYFTEKLIDCFVTKTVPIYWGAPCISDYFNPTGMICIENEKDALEKINQIKPDTYEKMMPYINENFEKAKAYTRYDLHLKHILESLQL